MNQITFQGIHSGISRVFNAYKLSEYVEPESKLTAEPYSTIFILLESTEPNEELISWEQIKKVHVLGSTLYQQQLIDRVANDEISSSHLLILQNNPNFNYAIISDVMVLDFKPSQLWFVNNSAILKFNKS